MEPSDIPNPNTPADWPLISSPDPLHGRSVSARNFQFTPTIEGYEISSFLGEGGMGSVWRAIQISTRRQVALKLLGSGIATSPRALARFEREVELTARLEHPNIARIYDSGVHRGTYFYAMELIDGVPLDEYVRKHELSRIATVRLMSTTCLAIQHAHQRGIIHRDLKPANILVSNDGQPHVLDFGVAKAMEENPEALTVSVDGAAAGTPVFMSPEQAAGRLKEIDTRTDVYTLGVIACRLLTGKSPHETDGTPTEVLRRIMTDEIRRPRALDSTIDNELEAVLLKAMAKQPAHRYASAGELARDFENYLRRDPLLARPPTLAYFVRQRIARHRLPLAIAVVVAALLISIGVYATIRVARERDLAVRNAALAEQRLAQGLLASGRGYQNSGQYLSARANYVDAWDLLERQRASNLPATLGLLESLIASSMPLMGEDVAALSPGGLRSKSAIRKVGFISARIAASVNADGMLEFWDVATGTQLPCPDAKPDMQLSCLAVSRDGSRLFTGGADHAIRMWTSDGHVAREMKAQGPIRLLSLSADATRLISAEGCDVHLWDVESASELRKISIDSTVRSAAIAPNGKTIMIGPAQSDIVVFDSATGKLIDTWAFRPPLRYGPDLIAYAPDGESVAVTTGGILECIKLPSHELMLDLTDYSGTVIDLAYSPDGSLVATSTSDGAVRLWDVKNKNLRMGFDGHRDIATAVAFPLRNGRVLSGGADGTIKVWDVTRKPDAPESAGPVEAISSFSATSDGNMFLSGDWDGAVGLWDVHTGNRLSTWRWYENTPQPPKIWTVAASPDGKTAACAGDDGLIRIWDLHTNPKATTPRIFSGHDGTVCSVQFSPDGNSLASAGFDTTIRIWQVASGTTTQTLRGHTDRARVVKFLNNGERLLSAGLDQTLILWDLATGQALQKMSGHDGLIVSLDVTTDGSLALTGGYDRRAGVWDLRTGKLLHWLNGHHSEVQGVCCLQGTHIAFTFGSTLLVWDMDTGQQIANLGRFSGRALLPLPENASSERRLVITDAERRFRIIDLNRPARYRAFSPQLAQARSRLQINSEDPIALTTFARWYSFRGATDWAADFFASAKSAGTGVPHLELARALWQANRLPEAQVEFEWSFTHSEAPRAYLRLCIDSIRPGG